MNYAGCKGKFIFSVEQETAFVVSATTIACSQLAMHIYLSFDYSFNSNSIRTNVEYLGCVYVVPLMRMFK